MRPMMSSAAAMLCLAGCTVLPIKEARALRERQQGHFDARRYVATVWPGRARDGFFARAVPLADIRAGALDTIGRSKGHRAGEGSPWAFVVRGRGVVSAVEMQNPAGRITLETGQGPVVLQTGLVIAGTAIRDAIPAIAFDDFPDQIAFAETGMALTDRAMVPLRPLLARLRPGDSIAFVGAASIADTRAPVLVTPVEITR